MRENRPRPAVTDLLARLGELRSRAVSSSVSLVGTSTRTIARRSPRPRPWSRGTPRPRSTNSRPGWVPACTTRSSSPSSVLKVNRAERRLGDRDRDVGDEVVAVTLVTVVRSDADVDVEVAGTPDRAPGRTPPGEAQRRSGVDAGGHVDLVRLVGGDAPFAPAGRARRDDHLAEPAATLAGARRDHLAEDALAHPTHLTGAVALGARDRLGALAGTTAPAVVAALRQAQR